MLKGVLGALGNLFFLVTLLFFLCTAIPLAGPRFATLRSGQAGARRLVGQVRRRTQRYLVVTALFGAIVAVIDTGALWLLAVPLPLVWGLFSFITNFIPNIGFVIGVIPPALLALLEGGWDKALLVVIVYSGINVVIQTFIQPHYVGATVGLSAEMTFLSLVVWTFLLGPLGALLAVPMTLLVRALLIDPDGRLAWVSPLISTTVDPPEDDEAPAPAPGAGAPIRRPHPAVDLRCPGRPRPPCRRPPGAASPTRGRTRQRGADRGPGRPGRGRRHPRMQVRAVMDAEEQPAAGRRDRDVQRRAGMRQAVRDQLADHQHGRADDLWQLPVQAGPADEVAGRPHRPWVRIQVDLGRGTGRGLPAHAVPREQRFLDPAAASPEPWRCPASARGGHRCPAAHGALARPDRR